MNLGRNDPCWCGSGKKFKKCHWGLDSDKVFNFFDAAKHLKKLFNKKYCLHPDANNNLCEGNIVKAHTIQRNGGLSRIARSGHVYGLNTNAEAVRKNHGLPPIELVGTVKASTFTGFCKFHDNQIFEPIEKHDFIPCAEHAFLLSYRSLCRELFLKRVHNNSLDFFKNSKKDIYALHQDTIDKIIEWQKLGVTTSLKSLNYHKTLYDKILKDSNFSEVKYCILLLKESPEFLSSGAIYPDFDFQGNQVQTLSIEGRVTDIISCSIIATVSGGAVVFGWLNKPSDSADKLMKSLSSLPENRKVDAIARYTFGTCENTYLSPLWWEGLSSEKRDYILRKIQENIHPVNPGSINYLVDDNVNIVDWEISSIIQN